MIFMVQAALANRQMKIIFLQSKRMLIRIGKWIGIYFSQFFCKDFRL